MRRPSIFLVENSPLFKDALCSVVKRLGFSITNRDPTEALPMPEREQGTQAKLILVDAVTFAGSPKDFEEDIRRYARAAPVLVLARDDHMEQLVAGFKGGAIGFVKQSTSLKELRHAIDSVARGSTFCDTELFRKVMGYLPVIPPQQPRLTKREEEVLRWVSQGQTNKQIAQQLGVSEQTIKVYISNLLRRTGATSRTGLAAFAWARDPVGNRDLTGAFRPTHGKSVAREP
jgi:two-component system nitrate/nitrite response regulator NarL